MGRDERGAELVDRRAVADVTGCPFCEIAQGERSASIVHQDASTLAFLDHRPLFPGHVLVAPRRHLETLSDVPPADLGPLFRRVRRLAIAVEAAVDAHGSFVAINNRVSQSVPHLHVHVVPRRRRDGLRGFFWPRHPYTGPQQREEVRERIRAALSSLPEED